MEQVLNCVKTFLLSSENQLQNAPLPIPKMHYSAIFWAAIPGTREECFYTTLYVEPRNPISLKGGCICTELV